MKKSALYKLKKHISHEQNLLGLQDRKAKNLIKAHVS